MSGLTLPAGWTPTDPAAFTVPGQPLAAWQGPEGATLVIFRNLWVPDPNPAALASELATRYRNMPGLGLQKESVQRLGGPQGPEVARVEAIAPGNGRTWVSLGAGVAPPKPPEGQTLVPTRRIALGWPREDATTWFYWHVPESAHAQVVPAIDKILSDWPLTASR